MKFALAAGLMVFGAGLCAAQFKDASNPQTKFETADEKRGNELIAQAVRALGGDNFLHMRDRVEQGRAYSFYRNQISGLSIAKIYTKYAAVPPAKSGEVLGLSEREAFGTDEDTADIFNPEGAWEMNWLGSKPLPQETIDRYRNSTLRNTLYILRMRLNEPGMIFESRGADIFNNRPVDTVDITDSENRVVKVSLDQTTHLPVKQFYTHFNTQTKERDEEVTLFSKYREVGDGIEWPLELHRERNDEKVFEIFSETVAVNQDLADTLFKTPAPTDKTERASGKKKKK